jgi:RNA polymerase sigma factor (sigma-70 family)
MAASRRRRTSADLHTPADTGNHYPDWTAVYADNADWVYGMVVRRIGDQSCAEDLTSEVFVAALKPLRITATVAEVRGYLRATTRTVLAAHWHRNLGLQLASIDELGELPQTAEQPISTVAQLVETVLTTLPDNFRRILELRFLGGYSVSDSARQMGISVANAKVLQHRALRLAAAALDPGRGVERGVTPPPTSKA